MVDEDHLSDVHEEDVRRAPGSSEMRVRTHKISLLNSQEKKIPLDIHRYNSLMQDDFERSSHASPHTSVRL